MIKVSITYVLCKGLLQATRTNLHDQDDKCLWIENHMAYFEGESFNRTMQMMS